LGDLLAALPSLALLREDSPEAELTVVCHETYGVLIEHFGLSKSVVSADSPLFTALFHDSIEHDSSLRSRLGEFVETWAWMTGDSGTGLARTLSSFGARSVRAIGPPSRSGCRSFAEHYLIETASAIGRPVPESAVEGYRLLPGERVSGGERRSAASPPAVVIHPGSGGPAKCWPLERFLDIAGRLSLLGAGGVLVTGEAEERLESVIGRSSLPDNWSWLRRPPLTELARLLGGCRFYLGNDSGVTHLAAACGATVLALFRDDSAVLWKPFGPAVVLRASEVEKIEVEEVWRAILARNLAHG
jgi:ADP-heptose:LPS heptosyltransferase